MSVVNGDIGGSHSGSSLRVLDSCAFTWVFDEAGRRFRRVPRGAALDVPYPAEAWRPYERLELNGARSSFAVVTEVNGTLVFRCWLHRDPCPRCQPVAEPSLDVDELRWLTERWKARIGIPEGSDRPSSLLVPSRISPLVQTRRRSGPPAGES